ncbi:5-formyltetrahydrofolate cyclo-ligase [Pseudoxanthomonas sp. SL93]|jgi:5-formyltetrahydrofolate cyclo-ligase|uniref:5-formyltetrahydrofolate cyclo-ligase n=1 Tax=Pseudoxanthomonas sp. SL93 TaxID=2995142 RepID=UPI00226DADF5|nr:5-formyltetrahydrofolate cyclo-ligase [Pseudoxanthomonas sp. SL93]WAC61882.1 5-formyltetrahydrofolate cyclo-ligase [Pseudoxanthomonas sp. SL93]
MTVQRDALRRELRVRRRAIPAAERIAAADALAAQVFALPFFPTSGYVAGYWAMDGEIGLHSWQLRLPQGLVYCLPVLADDNTLRFAPWRAGDGLVTNRYGIPEPDVDPRSGLAADALSLIVVPLVGFDAQGHRLGMGGGWYDRTLAFRQHRSAPPHLVGVGFEAQRVDDVGAQAWDVPLDAVCTEHATRIPLPSLLETRE